MGHKNRKTLVKQVSDELDSQFRAGKGRQKHIDKHVEDGMNKVSCEEMGDLVCAAL